MQKYIAIKFLILALYVSSFSINKNKVECYQCKSIEPQLSASEVQKKGQKGSNKTMLLEAMHKHTVFSGFTNL